MLAAILDAVRAAGRPLCLDDLSRQLDVEASVKGGCFLMNDGVARTYALPLATADPTIVPTAAG
jgi:hypothetical protein